MSEQPKNNSLPAFRQKTVEEDPLQFLWAVSYCDLLMVLMSFFLLFFQEKAPNRTISEALLALRPNLHPGKAATREISSGGAAALGKHPESSVLDNLAKNLKNENIRVIGHEGSQVILLDLEANFYRPGEYALPPEKQANFERVLKLLLPISENLQITFVGHADERPILRKDRVIDSNIVLSNLRAARAVEFALNLGFDPRATTGQGAGEFSRNTRSLSIQIAERRGP